MTLWSWLKLAAGLWLLRKAVKVAGWLLLLVAVLATWPLTLVALAGYAAAWWRGWPPVRLLRAAGWSLLLPAAWLAASAVRGLQLGAAALFPERAAAPGWPHPAAQAAARTFAAAGPGHHPGRARPGRGALGVAELRHHRRPGRDHRLGADHLRPQAVAEAGPHRQGPHPSARRRSAAGPQSEVSRSAAPSAPSATAGTRCSPCPPGRAPGTWSSSARPAAGRPT